MEIKNQYSRVLIVLMTKVKADDLSNLLIRAQFGNWPKDRLAQIHSGEEIEGYGELCGHYYRLQACDRCLGTLFKWLRGGIFEMVTADMVKEQPGNWLKAAIKHLVNWLVHSGIWEVIFCIRLSRPMTQFIEEFKPDLIYCQGYSLGFATLPLLIARRFNIPICFQTTDDWPHETYAWSPVGWLLKRRARELIWYAKVRLAFGEKMQREYQRRYSTSFEVTYHLDDPNRFLPHVEDSDKICRIIYTGSLGHRRYEAIKDLLVAVRQMPELAERVEILVYSARIPEDMPLDLLQSPEVKFIPLPGHEQLPAILAKASILLLPESFIETLQPLQYSISTKAHLYMMSGRPILVYGPVCNGTVEYAIREGWGLVVTERNVTKLKDALREMLVGSERMQQLRRNADTCIRLHHNLAAGQERFRKILSDIAHAEVA